MNLERYEFKSAKSLFEYEFVSEGPKGNITKKVRFYPRKEFGYLVFELGFGDWDDSKKQIDDLSTSNNHDSKKILATLARIVQVFTEQHTDITIVAEGSTPARTRLYQMGIVVHYQEIETLFHIYGFKNNEWQLFKKGVNYEAFAVRRK